jgi:hypothetical protein
MSDEHEHTDVTPEHDSNASDLLIATNVDIDTVRLSVLAQLQGIIELNRRVYPSLTVFRGDSPLVRVSSRPVFDFDQELTSITEMLFLFPALSAGTGVLSFINEVQLVDGWRECVCICVITRGGLQVTVYPWDVDPDNGAINFDHEAEIDPNGPGAYGPRLKNLFPIFATSDHFHLPASEILSWLGARGHEVQLLGDVTFANLNASLGLGQGY